MTQNLRSIRHFTGRALATLVLLASLVAGPLPGSGQTVLNLGLGSIPLVSKISPDLLENLTLTGSSDADVIVQLDGPMSPLLALTIARSALINRGYSPRLGTVALRVPAQRLGELAVFGEVASITRDRETFSTGHITATTGADAARSAQAATSGQTLDGSGVGIAVLDSGVYAPHQSLKGGGGSRAAVSIDFTGEGRTDDPYGHGSHVASAAGGNHSLSGQSGSFAGIAHNSPIANLRVLDSRGEGRASGVLKAIDWLLVNGARHKIRVVNMSFGAPAVDSYRVDPLCRAVRKLVDAGFVVVVAAGNDGKMRRSDGTFQKTYGLIHSPGNEPSAITVGATNTYGTDDRSDDAVASYSSRGPTRSYVTDQDGVKRFDNVVKPDLVAPGNRVIFAQSPGNRMVTDNPGLHAAAAETGINGETETRRVMYMSGTSVAAPIVAGAAALLLQAKPGLSPNMVKMILMYTAQPLEGHNMLEQGSGQLNIEGAVRVARAMVDQPVLGRSVGDPIMPAGMMIDQTSMVAGARFPWSQGIIVDHGFITGENLIRRFQRVYSLRYALGDGTIEGFDQISVNLSLMSRGIIVSDGILTADGIIIGDSSPWANDPQFMSNGALLSDGVLLPDGTVLFDGLLVSNGIIVSDGIIIGDGLTRASGVESTGDDTASMR